MTAEVDKEKCIACGMCAYAAPEVFRIEGKASTVYCQPDKRTVRRVQDARNGCPVNAITVRDAETVL